MDIDSSVVDDIAGIDSSVDNIVNNLDKLTINSPNVSFIFSDFDNIYDICDTNKT